MKCNVWGECGGCSLLSDYEKQLEQKITHFKSLGIAPNLIPQIFKSPKEGFRSRGEFRIFRDEQGLHLAMFSGKKPVVIDRCLILLPFLQEVLKSLLDYLNHHLDFASKLFSVEIMGGACEGQNQCLLTLIYHRKLCKEWEDQAREMLRVLSSDFEDEVRVQIIGRCRGEKIIFDDEALQDGVRVEGKIYRFLRYDNGFSQPNSFMNSKMIEFALSCVQSDARDLLEFYCGGGNFTIPLSGRFNKVFATEVAKSSIKALHQNLALNDVENVFCARLSGEESIEALSFKREFNRLRGVDLRAYDFSHILIDPPRSGVSDETSLEFIGRFPNIIYISCNPLSLKEDLKILLHTHRITKLALFDQFPYTHHLECGIFLERLEAIPKAQSARIVSRT